MPRRYEDSFELDEPLLISSDLPEKKTRIPTWKTLCGAITFFLMGFTLNSTTWRMKLDSICTNHMSSWCKLVLLSKQYVLILMLAAPAIDDGVIRISTRKAVAKFAQHNEFRGFPDQAIDDAWLRISLG